MFRPLNSVRWVFTLWNLERRTIIGEGCPGLTETSYFVAICMFNMWGQCQNGQGEENRSSVKGFEMSGCSHLHDILRRKEKGSSARLMIVLYSNQGVREKKYLWFDARYDWCWSGYVLHIGSPFPRCFPIEMAKRTQNHQRRLIIMPT